jgi:DNA-binding NarL/FixJ family response regulator
VSGPLVAGVLHADDHPIVRHGLRDILNAERDFRVVAEVEIADMLVISSRTVDRHRANLLEKLGMRDRVDLTRHAIRRGLVAP